MQEIGKYFSQFPSVPITMSSCSAPALFLLFAGCILFGQHEAVFTNFSVQKGPISELLEPYIQFVDGVFEHLDQDVYNVTETCRAETQVILSMAKEGDENALRFLDATGKPLSGFLEGAYSFLGFYSECLDTTVHNSSLGNNIYGKYCLVELKANGTDSPLAMPQISWTVFVHSHKPPAFGFCIPYSCSVEDLLAAVEQSLSKQKYQGVTVAPSCYMKSDFAKDPTAISVMFVFMLLAGIVISATFYEVIRPYCKSEVEPPARGEDEVAEENPVHVVSPSNLFEECFLSFSLKRNVSRLMATEGGSASGNENISALHGIRFLTMLLLILLHTYSFANQNLFFRNSQALLEAPTHFISQIFANGTLAVDSFYFMSGLLVAYGVLKSMEKNKNRIDVVNYFVHRLVRLTPVLVMVIAFCVGLLRYTGSGPNWALNIKMYDDWCRTNWWITTLYLQNLIHTDTMCLSHSWYLATDFQFYVTALPVLYALGRKPNYGLLFAAILFTVNSTVVMAMTFSNNFPAVPYMNALVPLETLNKYYNSIYIKPYCRMGPYLVGILTGYIFVKNPTLNLKKMHVLVGWVVSMSMIMFVVFVMWEANRGNLPSLAFAAFYSAFSRSIWAACVAWITVACAYGYGSLINSFLSWKLFVPLSRLTYCAYLIHPVIIAIYNGGIEMEIDFSYVNMLYIFAGNIIFTYVLSFCLSVLVESPCITLERVIRTRKPHQS